MTGTDSFFISCRIEKAGIHKVLENPSFCSPTNANKSWMKIQTSIQDLQLK
jgi:hypothetical protein